MNARQVRRSAHLRSICVDGGLVTVLLVFGAPFLWIVAMAFDRAGGAAWPWPSQPTLENFRTLFDQMRIAHALRNSAIVASSTTVLAVITSALAGFGLSRVSWKQKNVAAYSLLILYTFPVSVTMVPINDLARRLHLNNTFRGLILVQTAAALPFLIWLMKGYFDAVPRSLQEAAEIDGRSLLRAWAEILLPLVRPGLAVVAGLAFLTAWADVLLVVAIVRGQQMATISLRFMTAAEGKADGPVTAAIGVLYIAPALALFLVLRRAFVRGMANAGRTL
jgi:multiple sugar transport system permease protein